MTSNHWWLPIKSCAFNDELQPLRSDVLLAAHFELRWRRKRASKKVHSPEAIIRDYVRTCAHKICSQEPITRFRAIEDRINAALGAPKDICNAAIRLLWVEVRIAEVEEVRLARARERENTRIEALNRYEQQIEEIRNVDAFRSQVLVDPGMALSYWFMQNPDSVGKNSYEAIEKFACRIASYDPDGRWVRVAKVLQAFVDGLTENERRQSIEILRLWIARHGMDELADILPRDEGMA